MTTTSRLERLGKHLVATAHNEAFAATTTIAALPRHVVDVTGIHVDEPRTPRDVPRHHTRAFRRRWHVAHAVVGMKRSKMKGDVATEFREYEVNEPLDMVRRIVVPWNEERRKLSPNLRLPHEITQRFFDRFKLGRAQRSIKLLRNAFQIDVGRIHFSVKRFPSLFLDVARGHGHRSNPPIVTGLRGIDCKLSEYDRIVVREGHAATTPSKRRIGNRFNRTHRAQSVRVVRFGDVPILTKSTTQVTTRRTETEHARTRVEMVKWLFLDGIEAEPRRSPVTTDDDLRTLTFSTETKTALPVGKFAFPGTKGTTYLAVR